MKNSIIFFGSGPVASESLALLSDEFVIEAIITKPTTKTEMSEVCPNTTIYSVSNKSELDELINGVVLKSSVAILIDFGIIVSQKVIDYFAKGIINSHFSLLPELRGADPISFAVLEGKAETGVSLMLLVKAMDEGPIIAQSSYKLKIGETTPTLTNELVELSFKMLKENLNDYIDENITPKDQSVWQKTSGVEIGYTRKLTKQDGIIDWNKPAEVIEREIRAFAGWPKSRTTLGNIDVVLTKAHIAKNNSVENKPSKIEIIDEGVKELMINCRDDKISIDRLIPAGKKEMDIEAFLAGYRSRIL